MKPARRTASGGYNIFNAAVVLLLVASILLMTSEFTGFTIFPLEAHVKGQVEVMKNYTSSGSPHTLPLEFDGKIKSVKVSGIMHGKGRVKIVLAAEGKP